MVENSAAMGEVFKEELSSLKSKLILETRGRGLFRALEVTHDSRVDGNDLAKILMNLGLLTKATHKYSLRLAPALVIKPEEVKKACKIVKKGLKELEKLNKSRK
jgi:ornithine--oxo-acid transaminase